MRWTAEAETWRGVEIVEEAKTLKELMWILSTGHEDTDAHYEKSGTMGIYFYTAPRGEIYKLERA